MTHHDKDNVWVKKTLFNKKRPADVKVMTLSMKDLDDPKSIFFTMVMYDSDGYWHIISDEDGIKHEQSGGEIEVVGPDEKYVKYWCGPHVSKEEIEELFGLRNKPTGH